MAYQIHDLHRHLYTPHGFFEISGCFEYMQNSISFLRVTLVEARTAPEVVDQHQSFNQAK